MRVFSLFLYNFGIFYKTHSSLAFCKDHHDCYGYEICCEYIFYKACCNHNFTSYPALKPCPVRVNSIRYE